MSSVHDSWLIVGGFKLRKSKLKFNNFVACIDILVGFTTNHTVGITARIRPISACKVIYGIRIVRFTVELLDKQN